MKPRIWSVPISAGHDFELVVDGPTVAITRPVMVQPSGLPERHMATIRIETLDPLQACQLGQALLDASREAGARKAKARR